MGVGRNVCCFSDGKNAVKQRARPRKAWQRETKVCSDFSARSRGSAWAAGAPPPSDSGLSLAGQRGRAWAARTTRPPCELSQVSDSIHASASGSNSESGQRSPGTVCSLAPAVCPYAALRRVCAQAGSSLGHYPHGPHPKGKTVGTGRRGRFLLSSE